MTGKPKPPRCADCGKPNPRVFGIPLVRVVIDDREIVKVRHVWLCASCEYRREHPEALPARPTPSAMKPAKLQDERLFP